MKLTEVVLPELDARAGLNVADNELLTAKLALDRLHEQAEAAQEKPPMTWPELVAAQSFEQKAAQLTALLKYVRERHNYCYWCGTTYSSAAELEFLCPGLSEDVH